MKTIIQVCVLFVLSLFTFGCGPSYFDVPPNDIGMVLTPSGWEGKVYSPGQVDLGTRDSDGSAKRLVLVQRSGVEAKEAFLGRGASEDKEDHRCILGDKTPITLDVRLLLALPDYEKPEGKKRLDRLFQIGNPKEVEGKDGRVLRVSAETVYNDQARQFVRGRIRQMCASYRNFDEAFAALADTGEKGLPKLIEHFVSEILRDHQVPLDLVSAFPSNLKPDDAVIDAIAANQAAVERMKAVQTVTDSLERDPTGVKRLVYQLQTLQEVVAKANTNGHNTVVMPFGGGGMPSIMPVYQSSRGGREPSTQAPAANAPASASGSASAKK